MHFLNFACLAKFSMMKFQKQNNLRCTFSSFFHADRHEIFCISHIQMFLVEKWSRKWPIFLFFIISWFLKIFHEILICHIQLFLLENWPRKWAIFLFFIISWFLKIYQHVLQISLWWIFKNKKSEMYICFVFSCWSSWDDFDLPYVTVSGGKMA